MALGIAQDRSSRFNQFAVGASRADKTVGVDRGLAQCDWLRCQDASTRLRMPASGTFSPLRKASQARLTLMD